jgi:hypothetical protein
LHITSRFFHMIQRVDRINHIAKKHRGWGWTLLWSKRRSSHASGIPWEFLNVTLS